MFTLSGILKVKNDTQQVSEKFKKREFVVTDASGMYPQDILFQLTQERTEQLDPVGVNDTINVSFNLRGREWTSPTGEVKYFNSLDVWKIEKMTGGAAPTPSDMAPASAQSAETLVEEGDDDLPF
jgi:hypothetical protein